jgi:RND family efflux transporter MFP subunit
MFRKIAMQMSAFRENFKKLSLAKKLIWIGVVALILFGGGGGFAYYRLVYLPAQATSSQPALQTATVRQGNLILTASGTGTLIANNQVSLAFQTGGQVTKIAVKVGDQVKAGDVLAQVDDTNAQIGLTQAERSLAELTSLNAIATAQEAMATAATTLQSARNHLEYLISPAVMHWEEEVAKAEQAVQDAQKAVDTNPTDQTAQQKLKDAQAYLEHAKASLASAQAAYESDYVPNTFTVKTVNPTTHKIVKYIAAPTDAEILAARAAVTAAQAALQEATYLYNALTGGEVPANATGAGLTALEQARQAVQTAQHTLDGTRLVSTIDGTVMTVGASVGDTVGTSTAIITVADLNHPTIDVFLDPSDWNNVKVGYTTDVTFDNLPDQKFTGKVVQVDPGLYAASNSSVVHAVVKLDATNAAFNLPLGSTASVDVIAGQALNAVLVPIEALHKAGDQYAVFVMVNGKLRLVVVKVGLQDLISAEIISGLQPGDVVSTGLTATK